MRRIVILIFLALQCCNIFSEISQKKFNKHTIPIQQTLRADVNNTNHILKPITDIIQNGNEEQLLWLAKEFIQIETDKLNDSSIDIYLQWAKQLIIRYSLFDKFISDIAGDMSEYERISLLHDRIYRHFYTERPKLNRLQQALSFLQRMPILNGYTKMMYDSFDLNNATTLVYEVVSATSAYYSFTLYGDTKYAEAKFEKKADDEKIRQIAAAIGYNDFIDNPQLLAPYIENLPESADSILTGIYKELLEYSIYHLSQYDFTSIGNRIGTALRASGKNDKLFDFYDIVLETFEKAMPFSVQENQFLFDAQAQNIERSYVVDSFCRLQQELREQGKEYVNYPPIQCPEELAYDPGYEEYVNLYLKTAYYFCSEMDNTGLGITDYITDNQNVAGIRNKLQIYGYDIPELPWQDCLTYFLCQLSYMSYWHYINTKQTWLTGAIYLEIKQLLQLYNLPHEASIYDNIGYHLTNILPFLHGIMNDVEYAKYILDTYLLPALPKANLCSNNEEMNCFYSDIYAQVLYYTTIYDEPQRSRLGKFYLQRLLKSIKHNNCANKSHHILDIGSYYYTLKDYDNALTYFADYFQATGDTALYYTYLYDIEYCHKKNYAASAECADWLNRNDSAYLASLFTENGLHPAIVYSLAGNTSKAIQQLNVYKSFIRNQFGKLFLSVNDKQSLRLIEKYKYIDNSFAISVSDSVSEYLHNEFVKSYYDWQLLSKGLLLAINKETDNILSTHQSKYVRSQYEQYKQKQNKLAENTNTNEVDIRMLQLQLDMAQARLEEAIQAYIDLYGFDGINMTGWQQIQQVLKENEVAIEFAKGAKEEDGVSSYYALLLKHDSKLPVAIPLFTEDRLLALTEGKNENLIYNDTGVNHQITRLICKPLEAYIKPHDKVYFAATGVLHQIAFENMYYDNYVLLSDIYDFQRLSSTRQLISMKSSSLFSATDSVVLYGGITYNVNSDSLLAESRLYTCHQPAYRNISTTDINRGNADYLVGTLNEVNDISSWLNIYDYKYKIFTGSKANEESFKSLDGKSAPILHLATHGFFWEKEKAAQYQYFQNGVSEELLMNNIDPLRRCGLLMAGANTALSGHASELPKGVQDGVLTGQEIAALDLGNTELVVLSACETGIGEVNSDGVFGLQRAFKKAGVKSLIMSLWKVNDQATQILMTEFYRNWISLHRSKREAFRNAQNAVRQKYSDPTYWAGFIMLD